MVNASARILLVIGLLAGCGRLDAIGPGAASTGDPSGTECRGAVNNSGTCPSPDEATQRAVAVFDATLACGEKVMRGSHGYEGGGKPGAKDPITGTRELYGLRPTDRVERTAGGERDATIDVHRDGARIVVVHWTDQDDIGWLADTFAVCDDI